VVIAREQANIFYFEAELTGGGPPVRGGGGREREREREREKERRRERGRERNGERERPPSRIDGVLPRPSSRRKILKNAAFMLKSEIQCQRDNVSEML